MSPQELKHALSSGLLSFPLTDFDSELRFAPAGYAARLEWLMPYGATVLFAAGGTGEFFSLEPGEYAQVIRTAAETCRGRVPIIAGAGGGTTLAIRYAQEAERQGAQGVLLLPHYLTEATQDGLVAHVEAVCRSVKIGVVVYNRGGCRRAAEREIRADHHGQRGADLVHAGGRRAQRGRRYPHRGHQPRPDRHALQPRQLGLLRAGIAHRRCDPAGAGRRGR